MATNPRSTIEDDHQSSGADAQLARARRRLATNELHREGDLALIAELAAALQASHTRAEMIEGIVDRTVAWIDARHGIDKLEAYYRVDEAVKAYRGAGRRPACTGLTATWCPNHGDCACTPTDGYLVAGDNTDCPLHAPSSMHAALGDEAEALLDAPAAPGPSREVSGLEADPT